jgi:hypothetical protein
LRDLVTQRLATSADANNSLYRARGGHGTGARNSAITTPGSAHHFGPTGILHGATEYTLAITGIFKASDPSNQRLNFRVDYQTTLDIFSQTSSSITWGSDGAFAWNGASQQVLNGLNDGDRYTLIAVIRQGGARFFHNGRLAGTKSGGTGWIINTSANACNILSAATSYVQSFACRRAFSDDYAIAISANPWQIFEDEEDYVFVPAAGGGSTLNASASGGDVASGSADLSAQVALASVGVSTASGAATLAASVPLSAVGLAVAAGSATPSATVTISAAGLAQAAGQAGLSASVLAQAAGAAEASGNAELAAQLDALATGAAQAGGSANLSGGAAGSLSASGAAIAAGTAVLSVTVGLQAAGSALASGTATGSANAPGQVSATGGATAGGSGVMSARVSITAAGFVQAMGQGAFSATVPLSAFGAVTASGYAYLTVDNGVVMVRAPSGYRSSLIAYNSMRPRQSITIRPISLNTRR